MPPILGRLGWAGIAIEPSPGSITVPSDCIPYTANTLQGKHAPIADIAARGLRDKEYTSVSGKQWGEGDITINLDPLYAGYLFKLALGSESCSQVGSSAAYDHLFTVNVSNTPVTASVLFDKGAYREIYPYCVADTLDLEVKDGLATLKAGLKSLLPITTVSGANNPAPSGTVFAYKDLSVQFGANVAAAQAASPTKVTQLSLKIQNNLEAIYRSGSAQPDSYVVKEFAVSGDYGLLLESKAEVDNYYNLTKRCAIFTFTGALIGGSNYEQITITVYNYRLQDVPIETGIDNLFALKGTFNGEYSKNDSKTIDVVCRNRKTSAY